MPQQFGRFTVQRKLGEGGMGSVFLVTAADGASFALKTLKGEHTENPEFVKRFIRETGIALKLRHPNIVATLEHGQAPDGTLFMVTEFCPHGGLDGVLIARDRIAFPEGIFWLAGVARALDYAWREHHIIHRDIKPANLLLDRDWNIKLGDMGLARGTDDNATRLTIEGTIVGSINYMSPEQALSARDLDVRSDLYSLGATLYHLLTGDPVFTGSTVAHVIKKHVKEPPQPILELCPRLPPSFASLIHKLLEKDPDRRPAAPAELLALVTAVAAETGQSLEIFPGPKGGDSQLFDAQTDSTPVASGERQAVVGDAGNARNAVDQNTLELHVVDAGDPDGSGAFAEPLGSVPCGPLEKLAAMAGATVAQWSGDKAWLQIHDGVQNKTVDVAVYTGSAVVIGRAMGEGVDLPLRVYPVLENKTLCMKISSQHAAIRQTATGWSLTDLKSNNGVKLNEQRIAADVPTELQAESVLEVGTAMRLRASVLNNNLGASIASDGKPYVPATHPALVLQREANRPELIGALLRDRLPIGGPNPGRELTTPVLPVLRKQSCGTLWWLDQRFWWQPAAECTLDGRIVRPNQLAPLAPGAQWLCGALQFSFRAFSFDLFR